MGFHDSDLYCLWRNGLWLVPRTVRTSSDQLWRERLHPARHRRSGPGQLPRHVACWKSESTDPPSYCPEMLRSSHLYDEHVQMLGGLPNGIFVASAANFISEACTQNLRPMMSSLLGFCGLIGVTCGIATGFERIPFVNSGA
jgi:hypothetical protein